MSQPRHPDVDEDRDFQRAFWIATRVGWLVMAAAIAAALIGLTGSGGTMSVQTLETNNARIDLPRVARWTAQDDLSVEVTNPQGATSRVLIPDAFGKLFQIEDVQPAPSAVISTTQGEVYVFALDGNPGRKSLEFSIRAKHPSPRAALGSFEIDDVPTRHVSVVVLP